MQRGHPGADLAGDYPFTETAVFEQSNAPRAVFIENSYAGDPTNWWIPNESCSKLLDGQSERVHWYSLLDLPRVWPATTRHREAEGSAYYRHFHMGLIREDGTPKRALDLFRRYAKRLGVCQWFHFEDERFEFAVRWFKELGVKHLRTGLSWADSLRPNALDWFDRQMAALEGFATTVTFFFTPESKGLRPHHTSPPIETEEFADFCGAMIRRYGT